MYSKTYAAIIIGLLFFNLNAINAQSLAVNSTGASADASAILDVQSTTKGFLGPKMTAAQRTAISSPASGLLVYQTDGTSGYYYYNGSSWNNLSSTSASNLPPSFIGHIEQTGSNAYYHGIYNSTTNTSALGSLAAYISAGGTATINVYSFVGYSYTLSLVDLTPSATQSFAESGTTYGSSVSIGAWSSGSPNTGTISATIPAGKVIALKATPATSIATAGIFYTVVSIQ